MKVEQVLDVTYIIGLEYIMLGRGLSKGRVKGKVRK